MKDGIIYTVQTIPKYNGYYITLGDILETEPVDEQYFIPTDRLYYTDQSKSYSDETKEYLTKDDKRTWQYLKGGKRLLRRSSDRHEYIYSEGSMPMIDSYDKPARTMLTSEGSFSRTTHIVQDKVTGNIRLLTPGETERIQGFPTGWTKYCLTNGKVIEMPNKKRRFMMGNALVVNLINDMSKTLDKIFSEEFENNKDL